MRSKTHTVPNRLAPATCIAFLFFLPSTSLAADCGVLKSSYGTLRTITAADAYIECLEQQGALNLTMSPLGGDLKVSQIIIGSPKPGLSQGMRVDDVVAVLRFENPDAVPTADVLAAAVSGFQTYDAPIGYVDSDVASGQVDEVMKAARAESFQLPDIAVKPNQADMKIMLNGYVNQR